MTYSLIPSDLIEHYILYIREQKIMLDVDLAVLYGVTTKRLNEQVKRNQARFPKDFVFSLTEEEKQQVVANCDHLSKLKFSRTTPNAFTEHGVVMAASVLNSKYAIDISVFVVRAFIKLRKVLSTHKELSLKFIQLENQLKSHDKSIQSLVIAIRQLMTPLKPKNIHPIGFIHYSQKLKTKEKNTKK